jgi:hypothetical protein
MPRAKVDGDGVGVRAGIGVGLAVAVAMALALPFAGGCRTRLLGERAVDGGGARPDDLGAIDLAVTAVVDQGGVDLATVGCGPDVDDGKPCGPQGSLCATGDRCCVCGGLAGLCAQIWVCAHPARNDARCPAAMPAARDACSFPDGGLGCRYCGADGVPYAVGCTRASVWLECAQTGAASCWFSAPLGARCD